LWESSSPRLLKAGQHLFRAGDARLELYKVKSGTIRIYKNLEDARRQVMGFRFASDVIGLELQPRYLYSAQAIGAAILHRVPIAAVHALAPACCLNSMHAWRTSSLLPRISPSQSAGPIRRNGWLAFSSCCFVEIVGIVGIRLLLICRCRAPT
jgi:Cyclic nucleotide-binding domain